MNIGRLSRDNIRRFGEYEYLYFEGKWYTNVERERNSNKLGRALKNLGIKKGDRVGLQIPNHPRFIESFLAIVKIGAVVVPFSPLIRGSDLSHIYRDSEMVATIGDGNYIGTMKEAKKEAPNLKQIILIDEVKIPGTLSYDELIKNQSDDLEIEDTDNGDLATILYTGGTTGIPKGVMHDHFAHYSHCLSYFEAWTDLASENLKTIEQKYDRKTGKWHEITRNIFGIDRSQIYLHVLPFGHTFGLSKMHLEYYMGRKIILMKWWNAEEAMKSIDQFKVTDLVAVPTMFVQMLDHPNADKYDLSSLQYVVCGGAPLPQEIVDAWKAKYGLTISNGYGITEACGANIAHLPLLPIKTGSIGKVNHKHTMVKICDEQGNEVPRGRLGELVLKGPIIMKGYLNMPNETAKVLKNGWLHTGDICCMDEEGYLFIKERKSDLIIRGGENVYPTEVETILYSHPKVKEAAVVPVANRTYGEEIGAWIALKEGAEATEEEIIEFCKGKLPTYKRPKYVGFMNTLPKSIVGKILRKELKGLKFPEQTK